MKKKRNVQPPVPIDWKKLLTEDQLIALNTLERFGWHIAFIRRVLFQEKVVVIHNDAYGYRLLDKDGSFDKPFYDLRDQDL